ncbi:hypothetical protein GQ54DRAFT_308499 [Martensiomyces pterosporus]|nr:hypothetical protein GQ54DRAFT_308499 [Martensiomyces pterosporus]
MPRALTPETFQQAQRQLQPSAVAASFADSQTAASADPDDGNDDDDSDPATSHSRSYSRSPVTKEQKWALYTWLIENVNYPYPREEDMNGLLNVDNMDAAKFKTWFANTRKRQFYKVRTSTGDKLFIPNTKFFETCRRLGIVVPSALLEQSMCLAKQHNIQTCPTGLN